MPGHDTADVVTLLQQFPGFTATQSQYSSKISSNNFKKLIGDNETMAGNYCYLQPFLFMGTLSNLGSNPIPCNQITWWSSKFDDFCKTVI